MKVSGRDVLAKSHRPVHNVSVADSQLATERSAYEHLHRPYNGHNRFLQAATAGDLHFMRSLGRSPMLMCPTADSSQPVPRGRQRDDASAEPGVERADAGATPGATMPSRARHGNIISMMSLQGQNQHWPRAVLASPA